MYDMTVGDIQLLSAIILEEMNAKDKDGNKVDVKSAEIMEDAIFHGEV